MRLSITHDREPAIIGRLEPFVAVGRPTIGELDPGGLYRPRWRGLRPQAERAIDVEPRAGIAGERGSSANGSLAPVQICPA